MSSTKALGALTNNTDYAYVYNQLDGHFVDAGCGVGYGSSSGAVGCAYGGGYPCNTELKQSTSLVYFAGGPCCKLKFGIFLPICSIHAFTLKCFETKEVLQIRTFVTIKTQYFFSSI